VIVVRELLAHG
jgi:hypothetical protein